MRCLVCGKFVPRGRRLSHLCSDKCARKRRMELKENFKRRNERKIKPPRRLTKRLGERIAGFFNLFEEEK